MAFRSGPENVMEIAISAQRILKVPTYFPVLTVSKFQKQILLFLFGIWNREGKMSFSSFVKVKECNGGKI